METHIEYPDQTAASCVLPAAAAAVKTKYEDQAPARHGRRRSLSEPIVPHGRHAESYAKLRKPQMQQYLYEPRPRNRLQKRGVTMPLITAATTKPHNQLLPVFLYVLEYEHYPYHTRPSEFRGVYSSLNAVTTAALQNGAYAFSRDGLLDGSEYLSADGRIKILSQLVERNGVKVITPEQTPPRPSQPSNTVVRLDIPHPESQLPRKEVEKKEKNNMVVYVAIHQSRCAATCIGLFAEKSLAWGACLKSKASCAMSCTLVDEKQEIITDNMPSVSARVVGSGTHTWFVKMHEVGGGDR